MAALAVRESLRISRSRSFRPQDRADVALFYAATGRSGRQCAHARRYRFAPFVITPCFPSYASAHGSSSGAAREVLERNVRRAPSFRTLSNPAVPGIVLQ
jgi:hypothetical protein